MNLTQAYARLGWRAADSVLDSHNHPAREPGRDAATGKRKLVTSEANRTPSGAREDLGIYRGDAGKRSGPQISAIDVETEQGTQRILTSYDPETKTWTRVSADHGWRAHPAARLHVLPRLSRVVLDPVREGAQQDEDPRPAPPGEPRR